MGFRHEARLFFWGERKKLAEERRLIVKIDCAVLSYICLNYWCNYLDRANLANAYVTGMKEDVGFVGNDYTTAGQLFTAGYIIGQWPCALALSSGRIRPRVFFPAMAACWGVLTLGLAFVNDVKAVFVIRFFQAIFEASTFAGSHYLLGSWYTAEELGKRSAIFTSAASVGTLFSGVMQGAIHKTLDGIRGWAGWRWLFAIDFVITMVIVVYGYLLFPDTPESTTAWYFTPGERALCVSRLPPNVKQQVTWASLKRTIRRAVVGWRFWSFSLLFTVSAMMEAFGIFSVMPLWMKTAVNPDGSAAYSFEQVNFYPTGITAVSIVGTVLATLYSDYARNRFIVNPIMAVFTLVPSIILLVWNVPTGVRLFAYYVGGVGYAGQATNFAWANQLIRDDDTLRALTLASMNLCSNLWHLWYSRIIFPVVDAPRFRTGFIATIVTGFVSVAIAAVIVLFERRDVREGKIEAFVKRAASPGTEAAEETDDDDKASVRSTSRPS